MHVSEKITGELVRLIVDEIVRPIDCPPRTELGDIVSWVWDILEPSPGIHRPVFDELLEQI